MKSTLLSELESASRGLPQTGRIDIMRKKRTKEDLKESMIFFLLSIILICFVLLSNLICFLEHNRSEVGNVDPGGPLSCRV